MVGLINPGELTPCELNVYLVTIIKSILLFLTTPEPKYTSDINLEAMVGIIDFVLNVTSTRAHQHHLVAIIGAGCG